MGYGFSKIINQLLSVFFKRLGPAKCRAFLLAFNVISNALNLILDIYSMCGIAGIISSDPSRVSEQRLKKMTDTLVHRGPEAESFWISENNQTGFGHRRLCIIDLSVSGSQPMHYEGGYTIIYNGEIYNYRFRNGIEGSFYGLVRRAKYLNESETAFLLFETHYEELKKCYQNFFPSLKKFAKNHLQLLIGN